MTANRDDRIQVPVTSAEKLALVEAARTQGLTLSAWVRMVLLAAAKKVTR